VSYTPYETADQKARRERRAKNLSDLDRLLDYVAEGDTRRAFESMRAELLEEHGHSTSALEFRFARYVLTPKQEAWLRVELEKWDPTSTRLTAGEIPRGREVETPEALKHLPMRPPGR